MKFMDWDSPTVRRQLETVGADMARMERRGVNFMIVFGGLSGVVGLDVHSWMVHGDCTLYIFILYLFEHDYRLDEFSVLEYVFRGI